MADLTTLQAWLTEAEAARHALATGASVVEIWRDGRRIVYTKANLPDLQKYIDSLKADIATAQDAANGTTVMRRRSIGVIFGG